MPYVERYFRAAEDISALRGGWATKGDRLRKNVLRLLFPWPRTSRPCSTGWIPGSPRRRCPARRAG